MKTNVPSWTKFLPLMPFKDYQNFMEKNSEIERLRRTWKELWKLIQGYDLTKDAIYELDDDVQSLSSEVTTLIDNLSNQFNSALNEYVSSQTFKSMIGAIASNIASEYSKDKIDKVPDATLGNVSVFDDNHGLQDSGVDISTLMNSGGGSGSSETEVDASLDDLGTYDDGVYVKLGDPWVITIGDSDIYVTRRIIQRKIGTDNDDNTHTLQIGLFNRQHVDSPVPECKLWYRTLDLGNQYSDWLALNAGGDIDLSEYVRMSYSGVPLGNLTMSTRYGEIGDSRVSTDDIVLIPSDFDASLHTGCIPVFRRWGDLKSSELNANDIKDYMEKNLPSIVVDVTLNNLNPPGKYENVSASGWSITIDSETVMMRTVEVISENDKIYQRGLCYAADYTFYASRAYHTEAWTDWVKE